MKNNKTYLDFDNVMMVPKTNSTVHSRGSVSLHTSNTFKWSAYKLLSVPIIASNMDGVGTISMAQSLSNIGVCTALHKFYSADTLVKYFSDTNEKNAFTWYSLGISGEEFSKFKFVYEYSDIRLVNIDIANGHSTQLQEQIKRIRDMCGDSVVIMAGNCVTPEQAACIINAGADIVKAGIGGGSVCTTRAMTGFGMPQFSCIMDMQDIIQQMGAHLCSDGGCTTSGDMAKAFGAGADYVMLGGMLSGHQESEQNLGVDKNGNQFVEFYGSSSQKALDIHHGFSTYRAAEGKSVRIPYKGHVNDTMMSILGGLRSACSYNGNTSLQNFIGNVEFIKVTRQLNNIYER